MIPLLLAQIPVDAMQLFGFLGSLGALLWLWNQGKQALGTNPPNHERYIARLEYDADQGVLNSRLNAGTDSRKSMHKEIDAHGHRLASLEKGEQHTAASLANLDRKIDVLLTRTKS